MLVVVVVVVVVVVGAEVVAIVVLHCGSKTPILKISNYRKVLEKIKFNC